MSRRISVGFYSLFLLALFFCSQASASLIILDPGHGGKDHGAFVVSMKEKQMTLKTAYLVKKYLQEKGHKVAMTRARDHFLSLGRRVILANRHPSSLFISIHYNSAKAPSAKGIEVYYHASSGGKGRIAASKRLAETVLTNMVATTQAVSRGTKRGNFQVLRETKMPAILIEAGFITNREERALLAQSRYVNELAKGIAEGIHRYLLSTAS